MLAAERELKEAESMSKASGFAFKDSHKKWHNSFDSTSAGIFEMALRAVLHEMGCTADQADALTRKDDTLHKGKGRDKGKGKSNKGGGGGGKGGGRGRHGHWQRQ